MQHNGIAKLLEETAELQQILAKLLAYPDGDYPDGTPLYQRLEEEIADTLAAVQFFMIKHSDPISPNFVDPSVIQDRRSAKLEQFRRWDKEAP